MSFLDKAKAAAEQGVAKAKEGVDDIQAKREASQGYGELGKEAYRLIEAGEISHPALNPIAEKIRAAEAEAAAAPAPTASAPAAPPAAPATAAEPASPAAPAEAPAPPPPSDQPPAMPS